MLGRASLGEIALGQVGSLRTVTRDMVLPAEFVAALRFDSVAPAESLTFLTFSGAVPTESTTVLWLNGLVPTEALTKFSLDTPTPSEYVGHYSVTLDAIVPAESLSAAFPAPTGVSPLFSSAKNGQLPNYIQWRAFMRL